MEDACAHWYVRKYVIAKGDELDEKSENYPNKRFLYKCKE